MASEPADHSLFGLSSSQIAEITAVLRQFPLVEQAILFGSRAKGTQHQRSDIDLALLGTGIDRHMLAAIRLRFDESNIPYQTDVQLWSEIKNPALQAHIKRVGQQIYQRAAFGLAPVDHECPS